MFGNNSKFDYCGNVIYRDGALERLQGDYGYMVMVEPPISPLKRGITELLKRNNTGLPPLQGGPRGAPTAR